MATENDSNNGSAEETSGQEQKDQTQDTTPETGGNGDQLKAGTSQQESVKLPEDHPLVKSLAAQKATLASQKSEITELRSKSQKVTQLEEELKTRPTQEAIATLQTRYDRLEAFLQTAGGPLGKALDSRTFTRDLFETDKDISALVKEWNKANPSATSTALGSSSSAEGDKKLDMNALLRSAAK